MFLKKLLRFLLDTVTGKLIVKAIVAGLFRRIKKKIEDPERKETDFKKILDIVHEEYHADLAEKKINELL